MTERMKYGMATMMALLFGFSISACSVDSDGNDSSGDAELIGTWDAVSIQYYTEEVGYSRPGAGGAYWVITARTITEYSRMDDAAGQPVGYSFDGRRLTIDGRKACEVVTLTRSQMLLRQQVQAGVYQETTFKRR